MPPPSGPGPITSSNFWAPSTKAPRIRPRAGVEEFSVHCSPLSAGPVTSLRTARPARNSQSENNLGRRPLHLSASTIRSTSERVPSDRSMLRIPSSAGFRRGELSYTTSGYPPPLRKEKFPLSSTSL